MIQPAKKRFGQHFLTSSTIIDRIVTASTMDTIGHVVEIGPGRGAITGKLLEKADKLTVIELDRDLIPDLAGRFGDNPRFSLISNDVLKVHFSDLVVTNDKLTIIGNLPYNIGSLILLKMAKERRCVKKAYVMLQKEVGERLTASANTSDYSFLSVAMQSFSKIKRLFTIPPGAFKPPPKVDSAFLEITFDNDKDQPTNIELYFKIVSNAFSQRRKKVVNVLSRHYNEFLIKKFFEENAIDQNSRAENLDVIIYKNLYCELAKNLKLGDTGIEPVTSCM